MHPANHAICHSRHAVCYKQQGVVTALRAVHTTCLHNVLLNALFDWGTCLGRAYAGPGNAFVHSTMHSSVRVHMYLMLAVLHNQHEVLELTCWVHRSTQSVVAPACMHSF
jgi:hypothetical protein